MLVVQNDGCASARSARFEIDPLALDVPPHGRVLGIGVAAIAFGHPAKVVLPDPSTPSTAISAGRRSATASLASWSR